MDSDYYLEFENKFRGDRKVILEGLTKYDPLIDIIIEKIDHPRFLDIGCGRGEWLEKWDKNKIESVGIEEDLRMVELCRDINLNVLHGDALEILDNLPKESFTLITIFHMIEHIENEKIMTLLSKCKELLNEDGVLLIETPSIDSLLVSTKTFYIDPTHINHINPDSLIFNLDKIGFKSSKNFYINGGPLQNASSFKITRVLNGVAQDLLTIAAKTDHSANRLFSEENNYWKANLNLAPTTLEAAIEFDLDNIRFRQEIKKIEDQISKDNKREIQLLKEEILYLKSDLKYVLIFIRNLKLLLKPFVKFIRYIKQKILNLFKLLLNKFAMYISIRKIINSRIFLYIFKFLVRLLPKFMKNRTLYKIDKLYQSNFLSNRFNSQLLLHYSNSKQSKYYYKLIKNRMSNKET
ncbi:class I SAM-dependent methyltransferase [Prochlorococcus sp. MIT 0916]|uniref:Uncharacterized protein n=1 Tax=Prochlorococcus marinus str. P0903-H212 TaxID=1622208 RepID=A0A0D5A366_PROMR|nr:hypothetical protein FA03_0135 [Prochlorococcus marinus str. P0903-H212]